MKVNKKLAIIALISATLLFVYAKASKAQFGDTQSEIRDVLRNIYRGVPCGELMGVNVISKKETERLNAILEECLDKIGDKGYLCRTFIPSYIYWINSYEVSAEVIKDRCEA